MEKYRFFLMQQQQQLHYINLRDEATNARSYVRMRSSRPAASSRPVRSSSQSTMADDLAAAAAAVRKGPWTVAEDHVLVDYIAANGEGSWNYLARAAGLKRTGKSCRLRWLNYLRPDLRRGKMTAEEQDLIVHLHSQWGNRWSKIAKHLPGRTDNEVKNFWRTNIQQKKKKRRQHKDDIVTAAGLCSSSLDNGGTCTPATTEGQGSSSNNSGGGGTTTGVYDALFVTHDYGIVAAHGHLGDQQQVVPGGAAGGTWSAAAMDVLPGLLAASGDNFWAIDDCFWSRTQSCLGGNNDN